MKLNVIVQPQAKQNSVVQLDAHNFHIKTTAPASADKANLATIKLLSQHLKVKKSQLHLISGATSRQKKFELLINP